MPNRGFQCLSVTTLLFIIYYLLLITYTYYLLPLSPAFSFYFLTSPRSLHHLYVTPYHEDFQYSTYRIILSFRA